MAVMRCYKCLRQMTFFFFIRLSGVFNLTDRNNIPLGVSIWNVPQLVNISPTTPLIITSKMRGGIKVLRQTYLEHEPGYIFQGYINCGFILCKVVKVCIVRVLYPSENLQRIGPFVSQVGIVEIFTKNNIIIFFLKNNNNPKWKKKRIQKLHIL